MNLPNKISLFRILLVPVVALIMLFPYGSFNINVGSLDLGIVSISYTQLAVLVIFIIASISDYVDGYIARKYSLVTSFGKFIDPIADKLIVNTVFILLMLQGNIPVVPVLLMIWRDMIVDGLRMSAASQGRVVAADLLGKLKTVLQMLTIMVLLLNNYPFEIVRFPMGEFLLWLSALISVVSGITYYFKVKDVILESM